MWNAVSWTFFRSIHTSCLDSSRKTFIFNITSITSQTDISKILHVTIQNRHFLASRVFPLMTYIVTLHMMNFLGNIPPPLPTHYIMFVRVGFAVLQEKNCAQSKLSFNMYLAQCRNRMKYPCMWQVVILYHCTGGKRKRICLCKLWYVNLLAY